jgi:hypothetical protein
MSSTERIFDKTDKGREEIATRKYRLAPRLRTLLLLIDGKQTTGQLLQKIAGLDEQRIQELIDGGFIQDVAEIAAPDSIIDVAFQEIVHDSSPADAIASDATSADSNPSTDEQSRFEAIRQFYTDTIRSTLGLRGYNFQLKVDQASSIDDLRALHEPYIATVLKAKGDAVAREMHLRLEQLFNLKEPTSEV